MEISRIEPFLDYYGRLRQRTMAVVRLIPEEQLDWSPQPGAFSFGDLLRNVAAIERYVFAENAWRRPSRYPGHGRELADGHGAVLAFLEQTHRETMEILRPLSPDDLAARFESLMGFSIPVWKWLRAMAARGPPPGAALPHAADGRRADPAALRPHSEQVRARSE